MSRVLNNFCVLLYKYAGAFILGVVCSATTGMENAFFCNEVQLQQTL